MVTDGSWIFPNQKHKILIDHIITSKENRSIIHYKIKKNFKFISDHYLLTVAIKLQNILKK